MAEKKRSDHTMYAGETSELEFDNGVIEITCRDNNRVIEFLAAFADFMTLSAEAIEVSPDVFRQTRLRLQATWENLPAHTMNVVAEKVLFGTEVDLLSKGGLIWQDDA